MGKKLRMGVGMIQQHYRRKLLIAQEVKQFSSDWNVKFLKSTQNKQKRKEKNTVCGNSELSLSHYLFLKSNRTSKPHLSFITFW